MMKAPLSKVLMAETRRPRARQAKASIFADGPGWSYLLLSPFLTVYAVFVILPILCGILISFTKWNGVGDMQFVGLANYLSVLSNRRTIQSFENLFLFVSIEVPIAVFVGWGLALFIDRFSPPIATTLRAILLLPFIMPLFLTAAIWIWMLVPRFGLFNQLTAVFGLDDVEWLSNPRYMIGGLVIVETWRSAGFNMLLFYSGLKAIPKEILEAARIDGATAAQEIFYIIVPQLGPIAFVITVNALLGTFQIFDLPWLLTKSGFLEGQGGAGSGLLFPVMQSVASGFGSLRFGQGAAIGVLLMLLIVISTAILFWGRKTLGSGVRSA
jgi:multiple sugar transport system permease protein